MHNGNIFGQVTRYVEMKDKTSSCHNLLHLRMRDQNTNELCCNGNEDFKRKENNEKTQGKDNKWKRKLKYILMPMVQTK